MKVEYLQRKDLRKTVPLLANYKFNDYRNHRIFSKEQRTNYLLGELSDSIDNGDYVMHGEGESIPNGQNGDLIVRVRVEPHSKFRRDEIDIYCDANISMIDATLGTEIQVPTLESTEKMKIESGTQPNSILKLKGKGLPRQNSGQRGDQYIRIVVQIPKKLSKEQQNILHEFEESD